MRSLMFLSYRCIRRSWTSVSCRVSLFQTVVLGFWLGAMALQGDTPVLAAALNDDLRLTEIMYNPIDGDPGFEYLEFHNISASVTLDLSGCRFAQGVTFTFPAGSTIVPGGYLLLVAAPSTSNYAGFRTNYGLDTSVPIVGPYTGKLSNKGEVLQLLDSGGVTLFQFAYGVDGAWPDRANGGGSSLELDDPTTTLPADYGNDKKWHSSKNYRGSPGKAGLSIKKSIVINEVLSHTDPPQSDSIELFNNSDAAVTIGGWWLSDFSNQNYFKYQIPAGKTLLPGEYVVYNESNFNPTPATPGPNDFSLNGAHGDEVYLMGKTADGIIYFEDNVQFPAQKNGESFGRYPNGSGVLAPMQTLTLGAANSEPRVGPLVISELHYNPGTMLNANELEFVEIYNPTFQPVSLNNWTVGEGVNFAFPAGTTIPALECLLVVPFSPTDPSSATARANFLNAYSLPTTTLMAGPYSGSLSNGGERIRLFRPDEPPIDEPTFYPQLLEDEVDYSDSSPWPVAADGTGQSLTRKGPTLWGDEATNWIAAVPTPGTIGAAKTPPSFDTQPPRTATVGVEYRYTFSVKGSPVPTVVVENLPDWLLFDGFDTLSGTPTQENIGVTPVIAIRATNSEGESSQEFQITVQPVATPQSGLWRIY